MASRNSRSRGGRKKREPRRMFGKFKCPDCNKRWQNRWAWIKKSWKGNDYPAFGQQCNSCRDDYVKPYEWEPLQECGQCGNTDCTCKKQRKNPHRRELCQKCQSDDPCPADVRQTPSTRTSKTNGQSGQNRVHNYTRVFGYFTCNKCNKEWRSAHAFVGFDTLDKEVDKLGQKCNAYECRRRNYIKPYRWEWLEHGNGKKKMSPHRSDLCEACQRGLRCQEAEASYSSDSDDDDQNYQRPHRVRERDLRSQLYSGINWGYMTSGQISDFARAFDRIKIGQ